MNEAAMFAHDVYPKAFLSLFPDYLILPLFIYH